MATYQLPQVGSPTGTISWSDGTAFNGYALIGLKGMSGGGTTWPTIALKSGRTVPIWAECPILNGQFLDNCGVVYNSELVPPNTQYVAWYYDSNSVLVSTVSAAFTVSTSTFSIPALTLTAPSVGSDPVPQT